MEMEMEMKMTMVLWWGMILYLAVSTVQSESYSESVAAVHKKEKVTHLRFFLHDILSGQNPTAMEVAGANRKKPSSSPTPFGSVYAVDDALRLGAEPTSEQIGNAQGMYLSSSQDEAKLTIMMYMDFAFTAGKFNGSSFSVLSRNPVTEEHRELAIVGGRGKFRMARGYAIVKTSHLNATNGDAVLHYTALLHHY